MQREIAEVMASCALRGFRYISFPPIVFAAPVVLAVPEPGPEPEPEAALALALPEVLAEPVPIAPSPAASIATAETPPQQPPVPAAPVPPSPLPEFGPAPVAAPMPAMHRLAEFATPAPDPQPPPGRLRRLAELTAAESLDSPGGARVPRRYALLNDIAVELRPRRVRARTGRSP